MILTKTEGKALRTIRKMNKAGYGIWVSAIEDYDITKSNVKSLKKKGKIYVERSPDSGHNLIWAY